MADVALSSVDQNITRPLVHSKGKSITRAAPLPIVTHSYVPECPKDAPACSAEYPFTFSSNYTLFPRHFGHDIDTPFTFHVFESCYRPIQAVAPLTSDSTALIPYGLFYGPRNTSGRILPFTEVVYEEERAFRGYSLSQFVSHSDTAFNAGWTPNTTLIRGGDTTILFYFVGAVHAVGKTSVDPIFATEPTSVPNLYQSINIASPIICDTKYSFCADGENDCSPLGGSYTLSNWFATKPGNIWKEFYLFFRLALFHPPIYSASLGSSAIAASQTVKQFQLDIEQSTTSRELHRLAEAGMAILASQSQLSTLGFWNFGVGSGRLKTSPTLCANVIIETTSAISILVMPYVILLTILLPLVVISYMKWISPPCTWWKEKAVPWKLYTAGQMHRKIVEEKHGKSEKVDVSIDYPPLGPMSSCGLDFVQDDDPSRFGLGRYLVLLITQLFLIPSPQVLRMQ